MTSPVKLPAIPYELLESLTEGEVPLVRAYAEQAVRQALEAAAQALEHMSQEEFERPGFSWPTHMAYHQAVQTIRAMTQSGDSGHKPAPVDTSSGHSSDTVRTIWDLKERYRQGLDEQRRAGEAALDACRLVVERFGPTQNDYIFSKRMAIQKCRAALSAQKEDPPCSPTSSTGQSQ